MVNNANDQRRQSFRLGEGAREDGGTSDSRPFVGDAGRKSEGIVDVATVTIGMVAFALAVGFLVGFTVFSIMNVSTWLTALLWGGLGEAVNVWWFSLVACTVGGAIIGLWTWWSGDRVQPLESVMDQFRATGSYKTDGAIRPAVSFLLPLVFGGSVGFEAGLTGLIAAGCCWIRDELKAAGLRAGAVADVTIAASMAAIFGTPLAGIVAGAESAPHDGRYVLEEPDVNDYTMRRGAKVVLYTAAAFGAFGGVALFSSVFGTPGGLPRFGAITATGAELLWVVPCIAAAYVMTLLYHASSRLFAAVSARLGDGRTGTLAKPVVAGFAMGAIACALPYVLFPGESQSEELMLTWTTWSAAALIATGFLKAVVTPMCLNMGWMGGSFFPSIFAGTAAGFGLAAITGADPMLMVAVTATAFLSGVVRKPLLVLAILLLCFPFEGILWMGLAAVAGAALPIPRALLPRRS
ncbi:MAG: chloride channel protein [Eggerthellaceae bacterium]|nr:chloride channel protein [Eggerthellaceae bacterium]